MIELPDTVKELKELISAAEHKARLISYKTLMKAECYCDRYTCINCQDLMAVGRWLCESDKQKIEDEIKLEQQNDITE